MSFHRYPALPEKKALLFSWHRKICGFFSCSALHNSKTGLLGKHHKNHGLSPVDRCERRVFVIFHHTLSYFLNLHPIMPDSKNKATLNNIAPPQTHLLQCQTFWPSSIMNGRRLKIASQLFTHAAVLKTESGASENSAMNKIVSALLTSGPASPIFPIFSALMCSFFNANPCFVSLIGAIMVAPGAAKTKPPREKKAMPTASNRPRGHILNSAHKPYFSAANLWPSSCSTNANPTATRVSKKY